jgi:hypothetical protein
VCAGLVTVAGTLYLSAILAAPAVALAIAYGELAYVRSSVRGPRRIVLAFLRPGPIAFVLLFVAGTAATLAAAALTASSRDLDVLTGSGQGTYWGLHASHFLGLVFGLAANLFLLYDWKSGSELGGAIFNPSQLNPTHLMNLAVVTAALVVAAVTTWRLWIRRQEECVRRHTTVLVSWFMPAVILAGVRDNTNAKLWLPAITALIALLAIAASSAHVASARRGLVGLSLVAVVASCVVLPPALARSFQPSAPWEEAQKLANIAGPNDLVVASGWDEVAVDYQIAFPGRAYFSYADSAYRLRFVQELLDASLKDAICLSQRTGGNVYFVQLLDIPKTNWDTFLGGTLHLDFAQLEPYRQHSQPVSSSALGSHPFEPVRLLDPVCG